jgi:hypothetical protein
MLSARSCSLDSKSSATWNESISKRQTCMTPLQRLRTLNCCTFLVSILAGLPGIQRTLYIEAINNLSRVVVSPPEGMVRSRNGVCEFVVFPLIFPKIFQLPRLPFLLHFHSAASRHKNFSNRPHFPTASTEQLPWSPQQP